MLFEIIYATTAVLAVFANSVVAGSENPTPTKTITSTGTSLESQATSEVSGGEYCYRKGVKSRCFITTSTTATVWRTIGIVFGIIVFLLIVYVCVMFHKEIKAFFSKKRITKGANQQTPPKEGTIPLYHDKSVSADPHQKPGGAVAESEDHPPMLLTSTQRTPATETAA